jgi:hypothetical protein
LFNCLKSRDTYGKTVLGVRHVFDASARMFTPMQNRRVLVEIRAETRVALHAKWRLKLSELPLNRNSSDLTNFSKTTN